MRRAPLYSSSTRPHPTAGGQSRESASRATPAPLPLPAGPAPQRAPLTGWRKFALRYEPPLMFSAGLLVAFAMFFAWQHTRDAPRELRQEDIDAAVEKSFETVPVPSMATKAYEAIAPSVVRVQGMYLGATGEDDMEAGIGTGVVIVDKGTILTNLHVVQGAEKVKVVFFDGLETEATVVGMQPENDLAVLQAKTIPDDLFAATLRSTADLAVGDQVVAVGFPFGIGPSVSSGVVSGLKREFRSPEGGKVLSNLIQFDAAANPGNSGGPLVTADGEVVGIVTAILNPTRQRVFVGIGFAVPIENAAGALGVSPF